MPTDRIPLTATILDLDAGEVLRGDERVHLTRNELALLRYLVAHEGEAISKNQLHADVFGYAAGVVSRAADYAVHRLRKKIEADASAPEHLLTVPGIGFRLVLGPAPAAASAPPPPRNLPAELTSFLGRDEELTQVLELLAEARLVTLVGPGGVGKTRLAHRAAAAQPAAVWSCALSEALDAQAVSHAVASALGVTGPLGADGIQGVSRILASIGPALILLDNVEQVVLGAAVCAAEWLASAPELRILVTSRERLRVAGEHVVELGPLDEDTALTLFDARARMARPAFHLQDHRSDVQRLVHRLDGLPLAIELAAARSAVLSPAQILERLDEAGPLGPGPRGLPERQSSLERALAWSWQLLDDVERATLCQLTAFRADFDLDDAEAVVAPGRPVVDTVQALRDKSLLVERPSQGAPRFALLRTVRDFAEARAPDLTDAWSRHAAWITSRTLGPALARIEGDPRLDAVLTHGHDDLVACLDRPLGDAERFARAVAAAGPLWARSRPPEAWIGLAERALATSLPPSTRRQLLLSRASFLCGTDSEAAIGACEAVDEAGGDERLRGLLLLSSLHRRHHRFDAALALLDRVDDELQQRELGPTHVALAVQRGTTCIEQRRLDDAHAALQRALDLCGRCGAGWLEPLICVDLAVLFGWQGRLREQIGMARRALLRSRELRQPVNERRALLMLSVAESEVGRLDAAARHCTDLVTACEADHTYDMACDGRVVLAGIEFARGDLEGVQAHVKRARQLAPHARAPWHVAWIDWWEALACWARWGSLDEARTLLERALERARGHMPQGEITIEGKLLAVRAHLEPEAADAILAAYDALEARAAEQGRPDLAVPFEVDRVHVALARGELEPVRAALSDPGAMDAARHGLAVVTSRVLLASAYAEHELDTRVWA